MKATSPPKPACDIIVNGTAYTPDGIAVPEMMAGLRMRSSTDEVLIDKKLRITIETGEGLPHTEISNIQNAWRDARVAQGKCKWSNDLANLMWASNVEGAHTTENARAVTLSLIQADLDISSKLEEGLICKMKAASE